MKTAFCVAAALVASVNAVSGPESPQDCQSIYQDEVNKIESTPATKCDALVELSKCLGGFPRNEELEKTLISQQSTFCEEKGYWSNEDAPNVRVARNNMLMTVGDQKSVEFHRHRRETVNVFSLDTTVTKLLASMDDMKTTLQEKMDEIDNKLVTNKKATEDTIDAAVKQLQQDQKDSEDAMTITLNSFKGKISGDLTKQSDALDQQTKDVDKAIDDLKDDVEDTATELSKQLKGNVTALSTKVTTLQADVTTPKIHMWSGGAKSHSRGSGFAEFVLDRVEYDTAKPYFQKDSNTRFKALKTGLFTMKWNYMMYTHSNCNRYADMYVNNKRVIYEYNHGDSWKKNYVEITWRIKAGEIFYMRSQVDCGNPYRWHQSSAWDNPYGNRLQVTYTGDLAKSCTSNQGLC